MEKSINVYKMFHIMGADAFFELNSKMKFCNTEELTDLVYFYRNINRDSFAIELYSFNDGNNIFEEVLYFNLNEISSITIKHTMSNEETLFNLIESNDIYKLNKILKVFKMIKHEREKFGMHLGILNIYIKYIEEILS